MWKPYNIPIILVRASSTAIRRSVGAHVAFILLVLSARLTAAAVPECAHWTQSFVFVEFLRHAQVIGAQGQRLYFFRENPQLCELEQGRPCETKRYLIPGDRVVIGHQCEGWAHVEYGGKARSVGWVEADRLKILPPDRATIAAQAKWKQTSIQDPFERAIVTGDLNAVKPLLHSKADTTRALASAVARGKPQLALDLLKIGAAPNESPDPCQIVVNAVHGELKVLSALLDAGFPVNCTSGPQKISPLKAFAMGNRAARPSWAAMGLPLDPGVKEPVAMMQLFVHHGADLNIKDVWGGSPLRATAENNNVDLAALLLQAGADVNNYIDDSTSIGEQRGNTVLMEAVFWYSLRWDPTLVRLLLHHRADVDFRNDLRYDEECDKMTSGKCTFRGQTALTRAATDGLYAIARALLDGGANPTLSRGDGAAPAEIARANGHARTSELIEKHVKRSSASP